MTLSVSRSAAGWWHLARFIALVLVSAVVAHTAVYAAHAGVGEGFATAMRRSGHDTYWLPAALLVVALAALLAARGALVTWRTIRRGGTAALGPTRHHPEAPTYTSQLLRLWPQLSAATLVAFAVQENVEHLLTDGHLLGIDALIGARHPLALPVIAVVALAMAAAGAVVRWRVAALVARIAAAHAVSRAPLDDHRRTRAGRWQAIAALCAVRWLLVRRDLGRAPPRARRQPSF